MTTRRHPLAHVAVLSAPDRSAASTTTVPEVIAAISRLRMRNARRVGAAPGGASDTSNPSSAIRSSSAALPRG